VEPWGPEASQFTKQFLLTGRVRLQLDKEREDRYRRTLAYVWVGDRMLNEELIRSGLGRAQTQYNFSQSMKRRFEKAEREAKEHRRGIWSSVTPETTSGTPSFLRSKPVRSVVNKALSELLE